MKKLKRRYRKWKEWRKWCRYKKAKQWMVLFGIIRCPHFEAFVMPEEKRD